MLRKSSAIDVLLRAQRERKWYGAESERSNEEDESDERPPTEV